MKYVIVLEPSGHFEVKSYEDDYKISLDEWQGFFGGANVECIPSVFPGVEIIIDEEGKLKLLEENPIATELLHPSFQDVLVGNAVLVAVKKDNLDGMSKSNMEFVTSKIFKFMWEQKENAENGL